MTKAKTPNKLKKITPKHGLYVETKQCLYIHCNTSAVDQRKLMGRLPDHPWWKTGSPKSFLGCPNYFDLSLKGIWFFFLVINTKLTCFPFNHAHTYRDLGRPAIGRNVVGNRLVSQMTRFTSGFSRTSREVMTTVQGVICF